ncbi:MAG: hypothetical protein Kow0029_15220 [Candidatus Rifleibacteriota bacterium]
MKYKRIKSGILFLVCFLAFPLYGQLVPEPASETFKILSEPPDIIITANTMTVKDKIAYLEGNVKATRGNDILTCNRAIVNEDPQWVLASLTPKLYRKENLVDQKIQREMHLEARNIFYDVAAGKFNASDSVSVRLEERSWDLATYSWLLITSDAMAGYKDSNRLIFSGNVKIKDKDHFAKGNRLDYLKDNNTAILTGNAYIETNEFNEKKGQMEKRIIEGQKITYNTKTKEAVSE